MIRIFQLNDYEWFAGEDLESCIKAYFDDYLMEIDTAEARAEHLEEPYELDAEQLDRLLFHDLDGVWGVAGQQYTFREALIKTIESGVRFPVLFASTEY